MITFHKYFKVLIYMVLLQSTLIVSVLFMKSSSHCIISSVKNVIIF